MVHGKRIGLFTGLAVLLILLLLPAPEGLSVAGKNAAAVTLLMTIWWITEAIPIYATAFVPLAAFPLLGILPASATAANYGHNYVLMLLGGFFLSKAIEMQDLHKRLALYTIHKLGSSRRRLILSFMIASALLSMWIANVAVALLMLPIALAIISKEESSSSGNEYFGLALMLSIAYACSIGGTATLIGTPPNLIFTGIFEKLFPAAPPIDFFTWMKIGLPVVLLFLPVIWFYMTRYFRIKGSFTGSEQIINDEIRAMGKMNRSEKWVLIVFIITAAGWVFRRDFQIGEWVLPGWGSLLGVAEYVHDSTVAIFSALLLFLLPSHKPGKRLLDWESASQVPWGVVMIVGGGYAIAESFAATGLVVWIGEQMAFVSAFSLLFVLICVIAMMIFLTEVNSNTATANIFLPILATMAIAGGNNPLLLMIPATFACSFAFMLPSGTGTNAVIFASNRISIPQMARCGLWLNIISIFLLTAILYFIVLPLLDIESGTPLWAQ